MKNQTILILAASVALTLAVAFFLRITYQRSDFDETVQKALHASVDYDKEFINLVDRLEQELAHRASFGYEGGKDPMTGRLRQVVLSAKIPVSGARSDSVKIDPVKLTAIIFDEKTQKYTAVVMDNERSYSVEVNDIVRKRLIREISKQYIVMEEDSLVYQYDVSGKSSIRRK